MRPIVFTMRDESGMRRVVVIQKLEAAKGLRDELSRQIAEIETVPVSPAAQAALAIEKAAAE